MITCHAGTVLTLVFVVSLPCDRIPLPTLPAPAEPPREDVGGCPRPADVSAPLEQAIDAALQRFEAMACQLAGIDDYTCLFVKRERIDGAVGPPQVMVVNVRHQPFSVYIRFKSPRRLANRQVVWMENENEGRLLLREGRGLASLVTMRLSPTHSIAMQDNRYPITKMGMRSLVRELTDATRRDRRYHELQVQFLPNELVAGRACTRIQFSNPIARPGIKYRMSQVFVDEEWGVPIRFVGYTWPDRAEDPPVLIEEYTYLELRLNAKLSDRDFEIQVGR